MKKKFLNASVIGLGIGEKHLDFLKKNKNTNSITIFDTESKKAKKISKKYKVQYVDKYNKVFLNKKNFIIIVKKEKFNFYHHHLIFKVQNSY